jgi:hypothetical protein
MKAGFALGVHVSPEVPTQAKLKAKVKGGGNGVGEGKTVSEVQKCNTKFAI